MKNWLAEKVKVGGMQGTRAEYITYLHEVCGWSYDHAMRIACLAKAE